MVNENCLGRGWLRPDLLTVNRPISFRCSWRPEGMRHPCKGARDGRRAELIRIYWFIGLACSREYPPDSIFVRLFMMTRAKPFAPLCLGLMLAGCSSVGTRPEDARATPRPAPSQPAQAASKNYVGADLNAYPGDDALPILRKSFSFLGYWISPPPGEKQNTWNGKRDLLRSQGFGFAVLYLGPPSSKLKSPAQGNQKGSDDAQHAAAAAKKEGFPAHTVIFLDIEEGGRLTATYHAYLRAWTDQLAKAKYRAGVYCSGMPVNEGGGVSIITADDIRNNLGSREMTYWVFNDACPPAPGCVVSESLPSPSTSGMSYAAMWQISQSPRRKEFTARCAATYQPDGNCYAPGDTARKWILDLDTANSPDPSDGK